MKLSFYGHSFFNMAFSNANVITDPFFSMKTPETSGLKRVEKCSIKPDVLKDINLILISHEHFDHFEKTTVEELAKKHNAVVVGHSSLIEPLKIPNHLKAFAKDSVPMKLRGLEITPVQAHHPQSFAPFGYLISNAKQKIYFAGDTALLQKPFFDLAKLKLDLAMIPIGGTFTMDVLDAVRATKIIKPRYVVPMHYNTFDVIKQDVRDFEEKIKDSILKTEVLAMKPGQDFNLVN